MQKGALSQNLIAYRTVQADRDKLIAIFEAMKTSSTKTDRFQYIRQWHGTDETEPIDLTAGLVAHQKTNTSSDAEMLLTARGQLEETVKDGAKVRDGL